MLYVLDTDILSLHQRQHPAVVRQIGIHANDRLTASVISVEEQLSGWYTLLRRVKTRDEMARVYQRLAETVKWFASLEILSFTVSAIARFEQLRRMKLPVAANDLRIAAIALEHGAILVTRNTADFAKVPGLLTEDWAA